MILLNLFASFFKIGLFTLGGGYAMIPMISDTVISNGWISTERLIDYIAISESTPGPFAINIATFVGMSQAGLIGAAVATLGVVLPSFIIILIIARFFLSFSDNRYVKSALNGLRPAVVGLIAAATYSIAYAALIVQNEADRSLSVNWKAVVIFAAVMVLSRLKWKKKPHPVVWIALSAALGIVFYGFIP